MNNHRSFVCFLLYSLLTVAAAIGGGSSHCQHATEFKHTLPELSQRNIRHCSSLRTGDQRLLCELTGAIDAQGRQPRHRNQRSPANYSAGSCMFRQDDVYSLYPYAAPSSPALDAVMEKYTSMHQRCVNAVDSSLFLDGNAYNSSLNGTSSPPVCRYLLWKTNDAGLGNRLTSLITAFVYAIVSARALLIDYPEYDGLFCEPFDGSSIRIPPQIVFDPHAIGPTYLQFREARCGTCSANGAGRNNTAAAACNSPVVNVFLHYQGPVQNHESLSCPTGYARLRNVPVVTWIDSQIYLVPELYVNPVLSPLLDVLFPQRNPFQLLSRTILVPNDAMWERIASNLDPYASRRIGVQIREFEYWKNKYTDAADVNVLDCIRQMGGLIPKPVWEKSRAPYVSIYMATLMKRHMEVMNSNLGVLKELTGGHEFRLQFPKIDGWQENDLKHQQEAMVDIWTLSFKHVLFTTKSSTFGYVATALSGATRALLAEEAGKGCYLGVGPEPCNFFFPLTHSCVTDEAVTFSIPDIARNASKVHECGEGGGWILVSDNVIFNA